MPRVDISTGQQIEGDVVYTVKQPTTPATATPAHVGLVEITTSHPIATIPGPPGPQGEQGPVGPPGPGGVEEAPSDGQHYGRYNEEWIPIPPNPDWDSLGGKPDTFPPTVPIDWTDIANEPATFPPTLPIPSSGVTGLDAKQTEQDDRLTANENLDATQNTRITNVEGVNTTQDGRLTAIESKNASQDTAIAGKVPEAPQDGITYGRKNASWVASIGGATVSETPPPEPLVQGQLWYESDSGCTYVWYDDGNTKQWVQIAGPSAINVGDFYTKTQADAKFVELAGDTMTGPLVVNGNVTTGAGTAIICGGGHYTGTGTATVISTALGTGIAGSIYLRPKGHSDVTGQLSLSSGGQVDAPGPFISTSTFGSTSANVILGTNSAGNVYLRPNGWSVTTNQSIFTATGNLQIGGVLYTANASGPYAGVIGGNQYHLGLLNNYYFACDGPSGQVSLTLNGTLRWYWNLAGACYNSSNTTYKPGGGAWQDSSDARIKNVLGDYESGLEQIIGLRPVRYTFRGNDTSEEPHGEPIPPPETRPADEVPETPPPTKYAEAGEAPYFNSLHYQSAVDQQQFVGLIAQEAETAMPEIVTTREGWIDGEKVTDLRDLDTTNLIYALINAVKELAARVSELEAANG